MWSAVTSHNTPVTLLTNFQLVPGHTVISIRIPRFPELRFRARTWKQSFDTTCPDNHCHAMPLPDLPDLPDHGNSPPPTLSSVYSLSLASCLCPTLLSCAPLFM